MFSLVSLFFGELFTLSIFMLIYVLSWSILPSFFSYFLLPLLLFIWLAGVCLASCPVCLPHFHPPPSLIPPESRFLFPFLLSAWQSHLSLPLPHYWIFSSLLDHSAALGRQGKTDGTHLFIIKRISIHH